MNLPRFVSHSTFVAMSLQIILAYEWLVGGLEKLYEGMFVSNIHQTLSHFENGNPHSWYVNSMLHLAKASPNVFGSLVEWGELLVGIGLITAMVVYIFNTKMAWKNRAKYLALAALLGGVFMNLNFYYAAGWTSPSTGGLNMLMFWMQLILVIFWLVSLNQTDQTKAR